MYLSICMLTNIHFFFIYNYFVMIFICIYVLINLLVSHPFLAPVLVPRFRKPDNYLCSKVQKTIISKLRRSATAPTDVALKDYEGIFHDASAFVKRGLTIKRLRSAEFY